MKFTETTKHNSPSIEHLIDYDEETLEMIAIASREVSQMFESYQNSVLTLGLLKRLTDSKDPHPGLYNLTMESINDALGIPLDSNVTVESIGEAITSFALRMWEKVKAAWEAVVEFVSRANVRKKKRTRNGYVFTPEELEVINSKAEELALDIKAYRRKFSEPDGPTQTLTGPKGSIDNRSPEEIRHDEREASASTVVLDDDGVYNDMELAVDAIKQKLAGIDTTGVEVHKVDEVEAAHDDSVVFIDYMNNNELVDYKGLIHIYNSVEGKVELTVVSDGTNKVTITLSDMTRVKGIFNEAIERTVHLGKQVTEFIDNINETSVMDQGSLVVVMKSISDDVQIMTASVVAMVKVLTVAEKLSAELQAVEDDFNKRKETQK